MTIFLEGIELAGYRGVGPVSQRIAPLREINFFIGPNNAGKSSVLSFLANHLAHPEEFQREKWARKFEALDRHIGAGSVETTFGFAVGKSDVLARAPEDPGLRGLVDTVLTFMEEDGLLWLSPDETKRLLAFSKRNPDIKGMLASHHWNSLWRGLTGQNGGGIDQHWIPESLGRLAVLCEVTYPRVRLVPAIRQIGPAGAEFADFSGVGLIDKLAELQNPPHDQRSLSTKYQQINAFLRAVTESPSASIEVPFDRRHLMVHMDDRVLPLSSLGTGIHEVILLAAFCSLCDNEIICIEEPEIHLHPLLQRRFIQYLRDKTTNQYFIATHSASLIDSVDASVFSVSKGDHGETRIRLASLPSERYEVCRQLGYRASDLLQANAVIWVEGPSDRIYLNHWIHQRGPTLIEGIDYAIMFYGGRLLSHLSANDPDVGEFISLRRLNRNIAILIDSDRSSEGDTINATKERVRSEFGDTHTWVTAGREIENYICPDVLASSMKRVYPKRFSEMVTTGRYDHVLNFRQNGSTDPFTEVDKVKTAKFVCEVDTDFSRFDLGDRIDGLIDFIKRAAPL